VRLDEGVAEAWHALGSLARRLAGWDLVVLGPDRGLEKLLPGAPGASWPVRNGSLACAIHRFSPHR
jgi:putative N6-adenine-specific DNA methylase